MGKKAGKKSGKRAGQAGATVDDEDDDALLDAAVEEASAVRGQAAKLREDGEALASKGDCDRAIMIFTQAIEQDPNNGVYFARRSDCHLRSGRPVQAMADARAGASLCGSTPEETADCFAQLGHVLLREGQLQAAGDAFNNGLKAHKTHFGCRQGADEAQLALERAGGRAQRPPARAPDDVDAQPLRTLKTPKDVLGMGYEVAYLKVEGSEEPLRFLLSTVLTQEAVITPATCVLLKYPIQQKVTLVNVQMEGGAIIGSLEHCEVTGFLQAQIAEKALGAELHGMLGLPFMKRFDLDLDRVRKEQHFKEAGAAAKAAAAEGGPRVGLVTLPGLPLPGGLLGLATQVRYKQSGDLVMASIIDTGAMFTTMNWHAARALGIADGPEDPALENATKVVGATKEGSAQMPLVSVKIHLCGCSGVTTKVRGGQTMEEFEAAGTGLGWVLDFKANELGPVCEFGRVNVAIGDAMEFELLGDSAVGGYSGGVLLIGQDVLAQAPRLTVCAQERALRLDPPGRIVDQAPV